MSFSTFLLTFTLTWIAEKELERVIENKRDEFCRKKNMKIQSGGETIGTLRFNDATAIRTSLKKLPSEKVYLTNIFCSRLFSLTLSSVFSLLILRALPASFLYVFARYFFLSHLILTVSYAIIISTVKNNPLSPNAGTAISKERKLKVNLFVVNVVTFLTILPLAIWSVIFYRGVNYVMQSFWTASLTHFLFCIISIL